MKDNKVNEIVATLEITFDERLAILDALTDYKDKMNAKMIASRSANLMQWAEYWRSHVDTADDIIHRMYNKY